MSVQATLKDLYNVPEHGKAELVNGELICMSPTGSMPGRAGMKIALSLSLHEEEVGGGFAIPDNVGFTVDLPNRESFSPDAAWYVGDYGPLAERAIADKIKDYFAAGTLVVWDVDLLGEDTIKKYSADTPASPAIFRRDDIADAAPAVPAGSSS